MTRPPPPPLYTLCTSIRNALELRLDVAMPGSRVGASCHPRARPVVFGIAASDS